MPRQPQSEKWTTHLNGISGQENPSNLSLSHEWRKDKIKTRNIPSFTTLKKCVTQLYAHIQNAHQVTHTNKESIKKIVIARSLDHGNVLTLSPVRRKGIPMKESPYQVPRVAAVDAQSKLGGPAIGPSTTPAQPPVYLQHVQ